MESHVCVWNKVFSFFAPGQEQTKVYYCHVLTVTFSSSDRTSTPYLIVALSYSDERLIIPMFEQMSSVKIGLSGIWLFRGCGDPIYLNVGLYKLYECCIFVNGHVWAKYNGVRTQIGHDTLWGLQPRDFKNGCHDLLNELVYCFIKGPYNVILRVKVLKLGSVFYT